MSTCCKEGKKRWSMASVQRRTDGQAARCWTERTTRTWVGFPFLSSRNFFAIQGSGWGELLLHGVSGVLLYP